jgi:hypothetical protein
MAERVSDVSEKWGDSVAGRGFAQIPNYLMLINNFLDESNRLSPLELLVLLQLVGTWWKKGDMPFPSMGTLAVRCGVSLRQMQRTITDLEQRGLIGRVSRRRQGLKASNAYNLSPLVAYLGEVAKAFPNEFPRRIRRVDPSVIRARIQALSAPPANPNEAPTDDGPGKPTSKSPLRRRLRKLTQD